MNETPKNPIGEVMSLFAILQAVNALGAVVMADVPDASKSHVVDACESLCKAAVAIAGEPKTEEQRAKLAELQGRLDEAMKAYRTSARIEA